jgi:hypothetical protein
MFDTRIPDSVSGGTTDVLDAPAPAPGLETPAAQEVPGHPADATRCHVEDGPALSVGTAQMIACTAVLSWMRHDRDGNVLDLGRRRFANAEYQARQPDQARQPHQDQPPATAAEPQDPPWRPTVTEVEIMAAICDRYK